MDSMYQVAIEEMVEKAFSAADVNNDGKITYEEFRYGLRHDGKLLCILTVATFRAWALQDPTMISWLEALGSVF